MPGAGIDHLNLTNKIKLFQWYAQEAPHRYVPSLDQTVYPKRPKVKMSSVAVTFVEKAVVRILVGKRKTIIPYRGIGRFIIPTL